MIGSIIFIMLAAVAPIVFVVHGWKAEWINLSVPSSKNIQPKRSGHVAFINDKSKDKDVYVFGGYAEEEVATGAGPNRYPINDLWKFNCTSKSWNCVIPKGSVTTDDDQPQHKPQQRLASAAAFLPSVKKSYIFGGWDPQTPGTGGVILKDIVEFDPGNGKFTTLDDIDLELPTSRLVAITIDESNILLHNHRCTDHVLLFDGTSITKQPTTGNSPSPRGLHVAACLIGDDGQSKLVVFGGAAQDGSMSNELFVLDLKSWEWNGPLFKITGNDNASVQPSPRASPCLCVLDSKTCILFGGAERSETGGLHGCNDLWLLEFNNDEDYTSATWKQLTPMTTTTNGDDDDDSNNIIPSSSSIPGGRNAATLIELENYNNYHHKEEEDSEEETTDTTTTSTSSVVVKYFLLTGGWYPFQITYNDNFVLKMTKNKQTNTDN